jgi:hypothetical protein
MSDDVEIVNRTTDHCAYIRRFNTTPFLMTNPLNIPRNSMLILSDKCDDLTKNILTYLLNTYDDGIVMAFDSNNINLTKIVKAYKNEKLVLLDLSHDNMFKEIHESIVHFYQEVPDWLRNYNVKRLILPSENITDNIINKCQLIWLANNIDIIPPMVLTQSTLIFAVDKNNIDSCLKKRYDLKDYAMPDNCVLAIDYFGKDVQIHNVDKRRFI